MLFDCGKNHGPHHSGPVYCAAHDRYETWRYGHLISWIVAGMPREAYAAYVRRSLGAYHR